MPGLPRDRSRSFWVFIQYGPYTLPSGISVPYGEDIPLYLLVARWAVIQNRPLTSRDISEVFHIINRRASGIMLYISRLPDSVLTCRLLWLHADGKPRRRAVRVTAVSVDPVVRRRVTGRPACSLRLQ
ncbi:TPA: CaiF/GrlA family transcriptional regulator [Salmonella enterica]|nr:CaiF/GrlA family transcriptional regulator [Salmonella enterica subsp. enterica serovar Bredeney]HAK8485174.1 CaiF/GrlA family transcriptional regulator [Salmonella enterica]HAK8655346.1 CaiF/GrlA family transcriptional regulator [Salmonella enterica]